jgi:assimilatory nitrate reductase catalytic subunit
VGIVADTSARLAQHGVNIIAMDVESKGDRAQLHITVEPGASALDQEKIAAMLASIPGFLDLNCQETVSQGIFWPCYDESHPGTPRLYEDGFAFPDRRARFIPIHPPENLIASSEEYPHMLITGRLLEHFNTGEMSRRSKRLMKISPQAFVQMNPDDAQRAGLAEADRVRLTSPYGAVTSPLKLSESVFSGYLFAPNHFNLPNFNTLMSSVPLDPHARMPALKVIPVRIARSGDG